MIFGMLWEENGRESYQNRVKIIFLQTFNIGKIGGGWTAPKKKNLSAASNRRQLWFAYDKSLLPANLTVHVLFRSRQKSPLIF